LKIASSYFPSSIAIERIATFLLLVFMVLVVIEPAFAGTDGSEFQPIYEKVKGWVNGYLGKLLALFAFLVGLFYGAIKQNFIVALGGVGIAIMIAVMPALMESLVTAVI
jgi:conjugal transfer pilus assembly protein TraA